MLIGILIAQDRRKFDFFKNIVLCIRIFFYPTRTTELSFLGQWSITSPEGGHDVTMMGMVQ